MANMNQQKSKDQKKKAAPVQSAKESKEPKESKAVPEAAGAEDLRRILADTFVLYMKTYALHWNYSGAKFFSVHKLTETQYQSLAEAIDELAERMRAKGVMAPLSLADILSSSDMDELKHKPTDDSALMDLAQSHLELARKAKEVAELTEELEDLATSDMMIGRIREHEKAAWMLKSFMQSPQQASDEQKGSLN